MSIGDISLGLKTLKVTYHNREVGTLALTVDGKVGNATKGKFKND